MFEKVNYCKWRHLVAKFSTNARGAMLLLNLIQVTESISGSVVPLAMFHHLLTFLAFLVITTTFMDKTCTERTQTLVTCMVGGTDPFCPSPGAYYGARGVQNMAILGVNTGLLWQACYGVRTQPGNLLMRHITSHYMAEHVFGPFLTCPCTFMAQGGSKIWPFGG